MTADKYRDNRQLIRPQNDIDFSECIGDGDDSQKYKKCVIKKLLDKGCFSSDFSKNEGCQKPLYDIIKKICDENSEQCDLFKKWYYYCESNENSEYCQEMSDKLQNKLIELMKEK